jgi:hypothetical protein
MLVIWRPPGHIEDTEQRVDDVTALDVLLDQIHHRALTDQYPHDVVIYAGNRYPQGAHHSNGHYHPDDPWNRCDDR